MFVCIGAYVLKYCFEKYTLIITVTDCQYLWHVKVAYKEKTRIIIPLK